MLIRNLKKLFISLLFASQAVAVPVSQSNDPAPQPREGGGGERENASTQQASQTGSSTIDDQEKVSITIYNSEIGLVKDLRTISLPRGVSQLRFMDVAQKIDPTSVHIKSVTAPNALSVVEQSYEYDLLNPRKMLDKYVGQELTLVLRRLVNNTEQLVPTRATLLANNEGQVWRIEGQIVINPVNIAEIRFERLPADLIAKPTLVWTLNNTGAASHKVEASYLTTGIDWKANYVVVLSQGDTRADLNGWVTIENQSGTTYRNAELKLVAGDVNRVTEDDARRTVKYAAMMRAPVALAEKQFEEESLFEYHLYTLQRPTTIRQNETKQINLLSANNLTIKKDLVLNGQSFYFQGYNNPGEPVREKIGVYVEFKNSKDNNLGMPLPAGIIRVYQADQSGAQQFIGENRVDHTPKDESVRIKLGDVFDVVADRRQTDYKAIARRVFEYAYEIRLRNHKDAPVTVIVNEPIGGDWEILNSTFPAEKTAAFAARFAVPVPKDGEAVLSYRVRIKQ